MIGPAVDDAADVVDLRGGLSALPAAVAVGGEDLPSVRLSDTFSMMGDGVSDDPTVRAEAWASERSAVPAALDANRKRREQATAELQAVRDELRDLLVRGQAVALDVAEMARRSGVSRDTAHRLLRDAGSLSHRQKRRTANRTKEQTP